VLAGEYQQVTDDLAAALALPLYGLQPLDGGFPRRQLLLEQPRVGEDPASGLLISWATAAAISPSEASFSEWIRFSCAASSSAVLLRMRSSRVKLSCSISAAMPSKAPASSPISSRRRRPKRKLNWREPRIFTRR